MARKQPKITVRSYVNYHGQDVELATLPKEERERIGTQLALVWFNTLFAGKAVFYRAGEKPPEIPGEPHDLTRGGDTA